ncbi:MAG: fatty acid desaturase [bacterium]|nr:fatty acid desaturase [bacterium]
MFGIPTGCEAGLFLVGWLITTLGVSVGFHRLFTHKAFKTYAWIESALAVAAMMAAGGSLISWVAIHRRHHEKSDVEGDPHSPLGAPPKQRDTWLSKAAGFLHSHAGWMRRHEYPNPLFYCRDLYRKPELIWVSKRYHWWVLLGLIVPAIANGIVEMSWIGALRGFYFGGLLRLVLVHHFISAVNSVCHGVGSTRYNTGDKSTNCWWLAIPTVGESWHNNHHGKQTSAYFGHRWWELDLGGILVWLMSRFGLAWDIHGYKSRNISSKR